jgi:hypothetical protein
MDNAFGILFGIMAAMMLIYFAIYIIIILFVAAIVLVGCYFLGRQFYRQLTQKYRLTWISFLALFLIGYSSVLGALGLVYMMQGPQGYSYLLVIPFFLCMATATLGLWGLVKVVPFWRVILKAERKRVRVKGEMKEVEQRISRTSQQIKAIKTQNGNFLDSRKGFEAHVRKLCTRAGDQRMRILSKERLESECEKLSLKDIEARIERLKGVSGENEENVLEKCLLKIALIDARTQNAQASVLAKKEKIDSLRGRKQQLEHIQAEFERQAHLARVSMRTFKTRKIILK